MPGVRIAAIVVAAVFAAACGVDDREVRDGIRADVEARAIPAYATRTRDGRAALAALWPEVRSVEKLQVTAPLAGALLLAGWLRSRLGRDVELVRRAAKTVRRVVVDGTPVEPPGGDPPGPSDLLSEQLDVFGRDRVYEAAVAAVG